MKILCLLVKLGVLEGEGGRGEGNLLKDTLMGCVNENIRFLGKGLRLQS